MPVWSQLVGYLFCFLFSYSALAADILDLSEPTWHQSLWFKILVFLLILCAVFGGIKWRSHFFKHQQIKLQQMVAHQTKELLEAKQLAEASNQTKSTFLTTMSHQIRTPMNAVLGYSQLLQQEESMTEQQKFTLSAIEKASRRLNQPYKSESTSLSYQSRCQYCSDGG
jgi:signal transduction histidine kinase